MIKISETGYVNDGIFKELCKFVPHFACDSWCILIVNVTVLCLH